jgi:PKD repeat protein
LPKVPIWFCDGDSVVLDAGTAVNSWKWSNGKSTQTIKLKASNITGTQDTIAVLCYNAAGCKVYQEVIVQVYPKPLAAFTNAVSACLGKGIVYHNASTIAPTQSLFYVWTFADGSTSTELNPVKNYATTGTFNTKLVTTSAYGCKDSTNKNVLIQDVPKASFSLSNPSRCVAVPVNLTNNATIAGAGAIARSEWTFGDGFTSTKTDFDALLTEMKAYTKAGNYTIQLKVVSSANCVDSMSQPFVVNPLPVASFEVNGLTTNLPTNFVNTSTITNNEPMTYNWSFGESAATSVLKSPTYTYTSSQDHLVDLWVTSINGCKDTVTQTITTVGDPVAAFTYAAPDLCSYSTISFTDQSTIDVGALTYLWDFGDGSTSTAQHPTKKYLKAGTYTVALTATSVTGGTNTTTQVLVILPVPSAKFSVNPVCVGQTSSFLNLTAISAGTYTCAWTFGDGQSSALKNPTNLYATANNFTAKLKVTSALGCMDSTTQVAVTNPLPTASFTVTDVCLGAVTSTTNTSAISAGTLSYVWTLGNSGTSSEAEPIVTYAAVGNYILHLTVSSSSGCTASASQTAKVFQLPVVKFSSSIACNADTTYFTNQSNIASGTLSYVWYFGGTDTSLVKNAKTVFPNANTYTVLLKATSAQNCSASTSKLVEVKPLPVPNFSNNVVCLGQPMNFTNTSTIGAPSNENTLAYAWDFGNAKTSVLTAPTILYANAQDYTVKLSAESIFGCVGTKSQTVTVHALPTPDFTVTNACSKTPLTLTNTSTSAELQSMTYFWNFNDGTTNTDSIPVKTYLNEKNNSIDLTATTAFGCSNTLSKTVSIYPNPVVSISASPTTCINQNYVLTNNTTIKSGTFTNAWDFGNMTTATTLNGSTIYASDANYTISLTATSDKGCIVSATQNVAVKPLPVVDFTNSSDVNGDILFNNLTSVTPNEVINYNWSFGNGAVSTLTNPLYKYFNKGLYTVTLNATTASGCKANSSKSVKYPNVSVADFTFSGTACEGSMVQFTNTSVFSTDTLTYAWDFGDSNNSILKSPDHTYAVAGTFNVSLTVTPITGAPVTVTKAIVIHALPVVDFTANDICVGNNLNFINNTTPTLGNTYAWELGDGTASILANPTNIYPIAANYSAKLTVTTTQSCKSSLTKSFTVNALPVVDLGDTIRTCGNSYTLNAANVGSGYLWSTSETTQTININAVGLYKVTVTNTNACQATDSVVVVPNSPLVVKLGFDKNVCKNAVLDAKNQGATYLWSNGETTQKLLVAAAGEYSVIVTDANNCKGYDTVVVGLLSSPTPIHLGNDTSICDVKPLVLDVAQANASFLWLSGSKTSSTSITASGVYGVKVSYQNGCSTADTIQVIVKHAPIFTLGKDTTMCANNLPYRLNARSRSISYVWSDNSSDSTLSVSTPGTYFVKVTNGQACSVSDTVVIGVSALPVVSLGKNVNFCKGDSVVVDAGNVGSQYLWSNGKTTQTVTSKNGGVFNVNVTNASGCKANGTIQLNENSIVKPDLGNDLSICTTAFPKTITATSGYMSYAWIGTSNITNQIAVTGNSTLVLEVKDINNCVSRDTLVVNSLTVPTLNLGADTSFCKGNNFKIDAQNAGAVYDWSNGETTQQITVSVGGTYGLKITASNGCTASAEKNVTMNFSPSVNLGNDKVLCKGQNWTLNASNTGASYTWSTGETTQEISVTETNTYIVVLTDNHQCKATDQILVTFEDVFVPSLGLDVSSCKSIVLDAGVAATSYLWSTNAVTSTISAVASGEYVVSAFSSNNCVAKDTINVSINAAPVVSLGKDTVLCQPNSLALNAGNPGASFVWSTNVVTQKITANQSGTYIVRVTNQANCSASDTIQLTFNPFTTFDLGDDKDICIGKFTTIDGPAPSNGTSYLWSTNATINSIQTSLAGEYVLAYTNAFQCVSTDTIQVKSHAYPTVNLGNDTTICDQLPLDAANAGNTFLWNTTTTAAKETVKRSGTFWVKVTSPFQCATTDTINVTVLPKPSLSLGNDVKSCKGDTSTLSLQTNASNFHWNNGATTSSIKAYQAGTYTAVAQGANGCNANDTLLLTLNDKPVLSLKEAYIVCGNTTQALDAGNKGSNYLWTSTTGFSATQQVIDVKDKGFYYLKITSANACVALDTVEIQQSPNAVYANFLSISTANVGDTVKMINLSYPQPFTSKWTFGDGLTSTETDPSHVYYMDTTMLTRTLTVTNGVCTDTKSKTIKVFRKGGTSPKTLVKNTDYVVSANVYPNPNDGRFLFESELVVEREMQLDLYDLEGHVLMSKHYPQTRFHHAVFEENEIKSGMYFLRMIVENQSKIFKVIIVR